MWILPAFRSRPGVLSINYAEEMNQLDAVGGEREGFVAGLLPEQKRASVEGEAVC